MQAAKQVLKNRRKGSYLNLASRFLAEFNFIDEKDPLVELNERVSLVLRDVLRYSSTLAATNAARPTVSFLQFICTTFLAGPLWHKDQVAKTGGAVNLAETDRALHAAKPHYADGRTS